MVGKSDPRNIKGPTHLELLGEKRRAVSHALVYVFVIVPIFALIAAIPLAWGQRLDWLDVLLASIFYAVTQSGTTIGFHRYFTHKSFKATRATRIALAAAGSMAIQGPILHWVADHRRHHAFADQPGDPHSPWAYGTAPSALLRGIYHAHIGWILDRSLTNQRRFAPDLIDDPDIQIIHRMFGLFAVVSLMSPALLGALITWSWYGGVTAFFWASLVRLALQQHVTWSVNSICHLVGQRPFSARDRSTNFWPLAILSFGESWHNLHHADPTCARHGVQRGQIDISGRLIWVLEKFGLAYDVRWPKPDRIARLRSPAELEVRRAPAHRKNIGLRDSERPSSMKKMLDTSLSVNVSGPEGVPVLNNLRFLANPGFYVLDRLAPLAAGPVTAVTRGNGSLLMVRGEAAVKQVLTDNATFYRVNDGMLALPSGHPWSQMLDGVLTANGQDHRRRRKLLAPAFHSNAMQYYGTVFAETFRQSKLAFQGTEAFDMVQEFQIIARTNMLICLLGLEPNKPNLDLTRRIADLLDAMFNPAVLMYRHHGFWTPYGRWIRHVADMHKTLCALIERSRSKEPGQDALSILCHTVDDQGNCLTTSEIAGELHGLFAAGYETTASAMSWSMLTCLNQPGLKLEDIDAVISETQRLIPTLPVSLPRRVMNDVSIAGSPIIPYNAVVFVSPLLEHRNPDIFADALYFRPDRWHDLRPSPYAFLPFGIGPRRCIGARFADLQVRTTLKLAFERTNWKLLTSHIDYGMKSGVISFPNRPVWVRRASSNSLTELTGSVTKLWRT